MTSHLFLVLSILSAEGVSALGEEGTAEGVKGFKYEVEDPGKLPCGKAEADIE